MKENRFLSSLLVGRDELLALARRRLGEVEPGHSHVLFVSGEAGIGKTRLIAEIGRMAAARRFRTVTARLAPQDHDAPAAAILDIGRSLARIPELGDLGQTLLGWVGGAAAPTMHRRVLISQSVDRLLEVATIPAVVTFEDLQWADELTLEILGELIRRSREQPLLLVGSYRTEEVGRDSALRGWRSRLVTQRLAEEVRLGRLSRDETAMLTTDILATGLPAPREVVDVVYARTDGVPLHVEELLAALGGPSFESTALATALPETIEDATLARVGRLSRDAQVAARAGAVVGRRFVLDVLAGILDLPVSALDDPIQELLDHGILDGPTAAGSYDFRHQLLRDALYRSVPAGDKRRYHARAAEFGARLEGASVVHASLHYERAGMRDEAFRAALDGARAAARLYSRRESYELYTRAVTNMPASVSGSDRARILLEHANAAGLVDRGEELIDRAGHARAEAIQAGDRLLAAAALRASLVGIRREGHPIVERRDLARQVLVELERLPETPAREEVRKDALGELALVEADENHLAEARALLEEALEIATRHGWPEERLDTELNIARIDVIEGRVVEGMGRLHAIAGEARDLGAELVAVTAYRDAALAGVRALDYREAARQLDEGLQYADAQDQMHCGHVMVSTSALVAWAEARWTDALERGEHALVDYGSGRSKGVAHIALGYVALGRGDDARARQHLETAAEMGQRAWWLDVLLPARWGLAELSLLNGDTRAAVAECEAMLSLARQHDEWGLVAPFAVTGVRALQADGQPEAVDRFLGEVERALGPVPHIGEPALDHARGLVQLADASIVLARASLEAAIRGWDARGRRWEALWARLDLAAALLRSRHFAEALGLIEEVRGEASRLESPFLMARADELSRQARGRSTAVDAWHPLTSREFEVARAIAEGKTNPELADELGISPKTASSHVEHILAKLGATRRAEIAAWATSVMAPR
ncbi:MAG TPA: BREX system ATP-binding domain-containing protein [Candidatus Limnocylindrales bacterium]